MTGHSATNCPLFNKSKHSVHFFREMGNHGTISLNKEDDLKSVFSLKEEPMEDTLFSVDFYKELIDIMSMIST